MACVAPAGQVVQMSCGCHVTRWLVTNMEVISVDEAFTKFVGHGRTQWKYFFVINICSIISAFHIYATTFVDFTPAWRCQDKGTINSVDLCNYVESDSCTIEYEDGSLKTSVMEASGTVSVL